MKKQFLLLLSAIISFPALAGEGMWLPFLLNKLNADEMAAMGMQISTEDIYSLNNSSLKDAIVHFNGGCTAEIISNKGLILTNHHCGYSAIQSHSSLENNYLRDGFWAMDAKQELQNKNMTASIVKYMKDVTNEVMDGVDATLSETERERLIKANAEKFLQTVENTEDYALEIKPFFYGNQYILIAKEVFRDVRLVGAPPSSIGKFGADTDNWVWPRHTGDFSMFRIYVDKNNKPADESPENVPYTPKQFLKVNIGGIKDGDFTMVFGFPGTTQEYLPSTEVKNTVEIYDPARIAIREQILEILDKKMRESEATRIQYASKYARISNSWKKWIGEVKGLKETDAVGKKERMEEELIEKLKADGKEDKIAVLNELKSLYASRTEVMLQRYKFIEIGYYGIEMNRHMLGYRKLVSLASDADNDAVFKAEGERLSKSLTGFYKDYDAELDLKISLKLLPEYLDAMPEEGLPEEIKALKNLSAEQLEKAIRKMYAKNPVLNDKEAWEALLADNPAKAVKALEKADAYTLGNAMYDHFRSVLNAQVGESNQKIDELQRKYMLVLQDVFTDKSFYPDANSTLRLAYGKVEPYEPMDGVVYQTQTYLDGVIAKYVPGDYEFDLPEKLIDLYENKDYGKYGEGDKMPVCFIASNHTTGGNSGSPALNAKGELIGLNFDRAWEGTMSDINYDKSRCRNIMVDLRYVLFIVDKFAGAGYLVDEMELVQ